MSAPFVLVLRLILAASLYGFLALALITLWREVRTQGESLAARKTPSLSMQIQRGGEPPARRFFNQPEILMGRDSHCDVVLSDETVSVRHARLSFHHGQWWLEDLDSTNGVKINGHPTRKNLLQDGARIQLGSVQLEFRDTGYIHTNSVKVDVR